MKQASGPFKGPGFMHNSLLQFHVSQAYAWTAVLCVAVMCAILCIGGSRGYRVQLGQPLHAVIAAKQT